MQKPLDSSAFDYAWNQLLAACHGSIETGGSPGISVAASFGDIERHAQFGVTSLDRPNPIKPNTLFQIGSLTKMLTATAVAQLASQGEINLDKPVVSYLDFTFADREASSAMTARHFLSHSSGVIADNNAGHPSDLSDPALSAYVAACKALPVLDYPGRSFRYCSPAWVVLGHLIETITNLSWEQVVEELILTPCGLDEIAVDSEKLPKYDSSEGHLKPSAIRQFIVMPFSRYPRCVAPSGGGSASARGLLKFAQIHLQLGINDSGEQVLSRNAIAEMQSPAIAFNGPPGGASAWGLGWAIYHWGDTTVLGQGGVVFGQSSLLLLCPQHSLAIAILANTGHGEPLCESIARNFISRALRIEVPDFVGYG